MLDIHCHILAWVDDGSENFEMSLNMCKVAELDGIRTIIATPHYISGERGNPKAELIVDMTKELNNQLERQGIYVNILPGMEVYISPDLPELYKNGQILTLNNSRYMLIELPMNNIPLYTNDVIYSLQMNDMVPVIAHPERNVVLRNKQGKIDELIEKGALMQVNAGSLRGAFGESVQKAAFDMVNKRLIHFIATDAHSDKKRRPELREAYDMIRNMDKDLFLKVADNSYKILNNKEIQVECIVECRTKAEASNMGFLCPILGK